jgi:hypothetical protein
MTCIDLRQRYGSRYRVTCEPSCERVHHNDQCDPWYATILCEYGYIYPHGGKQLGASTNRRGPTARRLVALPRVCLVQDGDDSVNVVFDASDFDRVAAIMKPRRKRVLTPEQKAERVARLSKYQFSAASQSGSEARLRHSSQAPDPSHLTHNHAPRHANSSTNP